MRKRRWQDRWSDRCGWLLRDSEAGQAKGLRKAAQWWSLCSRLLHLSVLISALSSVVHLVPVLAVMVGTVGADRHCEAELELTSENVAEGGQRWTQKARHQSQKDPAGAYLAAWPPDDTFLRGCEICEDGGEPVGMNVCLCGKSKWFRQEMSPDFRVQFRQAKIEFPISNGFGD